MSSPFQYFSFRMDAAFKKFDKDFTKMLEDKEDYNVILTCYKSFSQEFFKESSEAFMFYENLSNDFTRLLESSKECDSTIEVGKAPSKKTFATHSSVLCFRCPQLYKELTANNNENQKTIKKPNLSPRVFDFIIRYLYSGVLELREEPSVLFDLLAAANEFKIIELAKYLEAYFIEKHSPWLRSNFTRVHREIFQYQYLVSLQEFCDDTIANYPDLVFESKDFETLQENALISILRRDDLRLEETKIWDYVIKWGKAQYQNFPSRLEQWSDADFQRLQTILQNCLPQIRFFQIPGSDAYEKLQPYKPIIDPIIWSDIMKKFMAPNMSITSTVLPARCLIESVVISNDQARRIVSWVDKRNSAYEYLSDSPFRLKLILRGSRDGFSPAKFWDLCERKESLVIVMKVKDTGEIIGGYNPIGWERKQSVGYTETIESFIFSFDMHNSTWSRVRNINKAIYNHNKGSSAYGPCFGTYDLVLRDNFKDKAECYCVKSDYEKPIRDLKTHFSVDEYEVFQLMEKIPNAQ